MPTRRPVSALTHPFHVAARATSTRPVVVNVAFPPVPPERTSEAAGRLGATNTTALDTAMTPGSGNPPKGALFQLPLGRAPNHPAHSRNRIIVRSVDANDRKLLAMTLPSKDEEALIARAKEDPECFGELYDRYFPQIYRYVASRVRNQSLAEDITSEVFFKALRAIGRYHHTGHPFSAWLYQIAVNAITDHYRARKRSEDSLDEVPELVDPSIPVEDVVADRLGTGDIWALIEALPEQQRVAMTLKYGQDLKLAEIGIIMGKTEGAVKLLVFRGTATLRQRLQARWQTASDGTTRG
jgi:RNA polymerase sigma-70 factor (ECF subfamily)